MEGEETGDGWSGLGVRVRLNGQICGGGGGKKERGNFHLLLL